MRRFTWGGVKRRIQGGWREGWNALRSPNGHPLFIPPSKWPEPFPAGINNWAARYIGKTRTHYPPSWRDRLAELAANPRPTPRVAVVMHVYYLDLVGELIDQLSAIPVEFDLLITNSSGLPLEIDPARMGNLRQVVVFEIPNHGRDIMPFAAVVNTNALNPYDLILKIHTKRSVWRADHEALEGSGDDWRAELLGSLLGDRDNVSMILSGFAEHPEIGLYTAPGSIVGEEHWGADYEITRHLLQRLELDLAAHELVFAAGSMYWIRGFLAQGLYSLRLSPEDFEPEDGQVDGTTAHGVERAIGILTREAGYQLVDAMPVADDPRAWERFRRESPRIPRARVFPFYLPQFHAIAENDLWWGPGFTEWSNVSSAQPVFRGHSQPLLPSRLGFYDLTSPDVQIRQADLAQASGIEGFMYYYYWFAGRQLMSEPVERIAEAGTTPFSIMWANENWSRRWDGGDDDILIGQQYAKVSANAFIEDVAHLLKSPNYIRVEGKPLIAVYRISQIPDFESVIDHWRDYARHEGIGELFLLTVDVGVGMQGLDGDPELHGLDGCLEFPPHNTLWEYADTTHLYPEHAFRGRIMSYAMTVKSSESRFRFPLPAWRNPGVMVSFDNTARRQWHPDIWYGSNPYTFRRWLSATLSAVATREQSRRIVFVNAWNEWAESAVLEPSMRHGDAYLLAVRDALLY